MRRSGNFKRKTGETDIKLSLNLDGKGEYRIETGVPFFNHMLDQFSKHSGFDMTLKAKGDISVDLHHLIEDTGIVIGGALKELSGDKKGINRFGFASIPMDEALVQSSVDFCGRNFFVYNKYGCDAQNKSLLKKKLAYANSALSDKKRNSKSGKAADYDMLDIFISETMAENFFHDYLNIFFDSLSKNALLTMHINVMYGQNLHHIVEAAFKSAGIALAFSLKTDGRKGIPSTKGII